VLYLDAVTKKHPGWLIEYPMDNDRETLFKDAPRLTGVLNLKRRTIEFNVKQCRTGSDDNGPLTDSALDTETSTHITP